VLGVVPDLLICWAAARLTDSGWSGFFIAILSLQAVYLFFWFKTACWAWLLFWAYDKRRMASYFEKWFVEARLPAPDAYTSNDLEVYLDEIANDEQIECATRVKVAFELGTINGLKTGGRFSAVFMLNLAGSRALKRLEKRYRFNTADVRFARKSDIS
jgi:hypothetical protein